MDKIIALLKFAVDNEHNFTENDPDGVKRAWIEQARKALAAQQSTKAGENRDCPNCHYHNKEIRCRSCGHTYTPHP